MEASDILQNATRGIRAVQTHRDRPTVRTTYQLAARLSPKEGQDEEEVWIAVVKSIIGWVRGLCSSEVPQEAWEGKDFECGVPGHNVECATVPSEGLWSLRLTHPDAPHIDRQAVPGKDVDDGSGFETGRGRDSPSRCASALYLATILRR